MRYRTNLWKKGEEIIYKCKFCTTNNTISHGDTNAMQTTHGNEEMGSIKTGKVGVELIKTNIKENILQGETSAISTQIYNNANHINTGNDTINTLGENNANRSHGELNQIYMQEENLPVTIQALLKMTLREILKIYAISAGITLKIITKTFSAIVVLVLFIRDATKRPALGTHIARFV